MKKFFAALILVCMSVTAFASCTAGGNKTANSTVTSQGPVRTVEDDGLPELNFDNQTVVFITEALDKETLGNSSHAADLYRDSITNDVLNDAIYNRTKKVEERLGIKLKFHIETQESAHAVCNDSVLTGLDEYQILGGGSASTYSSVHSGYYLNLLDERYTGYLGLDREWWNQYMIENSTVYGNCSVITGSLSLSYVRDSYGTFFSKAVADEHNVTTDFYQLVRDGEWTIDKQLELIRGFYSDITGDGKTMDDAYGLLFDDNCTLDAYWSAFDMSLLRRTDDGGFEWTDKQEKITNATTKVYSMMYENKDAYVYRALQLELDGQNPYELITDAFANKQALFITLRLKDCDRESLRGMKEGYGILPMPKWDTDQDDYYTYISDQFDVYAIPKTVQRVDAATATLEALAIESYKYVAPAYYNKVLNGRYMSDPDSSEMLDKITTNVKLTPEWIFAFALERMPQYSFRYLLRDGDSNFKTYWRQSHKKYTKALSNMLDDYIKLES